MKLTNTFTVAGLVLLLSIFTSCEKDDIVITGNGVVNLEFDHIVGTQGLQLGTQIYTNAHGDDFKVDAFKYYVSNIKFKKADGSTTAVSENYLLIDAADPASLLQTLENIPAGDYTGMELLIGVDEARNFAGAQTGALDPAKGMFWSWNTGYIFMKFEGTSSKSTQTSHQLTFHVGGAKAPVNAIRTVSLVFPAALRIRNNTEPDVHFFVDVSSLFKGVTTIDFSSVSGFHGGANGLLMADNYASGLLKVDHIHN